MLLSRPNTKQSVADAECVISPIDGWTSPSPLSGPAAVSTSPPHRTVDGVDQVPRRGEIWLMALKLHARRPIAIRIALDATAALTSGRESSGAHAWRDKANVRSACRWRSADRAIGNTSSTIVTSLIFAHNILRYLANQLLPLKGGIHLWSSNRLVLEHLNWLCIVHWYDV